MKRLILILLASLAALSAAAEISPRASLGRNDKVNISSPTPTETITRVELSEEQKPFVAAGNAFAVKCLKSLFDDESMVFSPLSLQYALALAANGASGETAAEIVQALGFGEDKAALNSYCNRRCR